VFLPIWAKRPVFQFCFARRAKRCFGDSVIGGGGGDWWWWWWWWWGGVAQTKLLNARPFANK